MMIKQIESGTVLTLNWAIGGIVEFRVIVANFSKSNCYQKSNKKPKGKEGDNFYKYKIYCYNNEIGDIKGEDRSNL